MGSKSRAWVLGLVAAVFLVYAGRILYIRKHLLFQGPLAVEPIGSFEPAAGEPQAWIRTSFGYHLAHWPRSFRGSPIVTSMEYRKGPPKNFISEMVQIWGTGQAELRIEGPRTPIAGFTAVEWKSCFNSLFCTARQGVFSERVVRDWMEDRAHLVSVRWFESGQLGGARGVHLRMDLGDRELDRWVVITDFGNTQNFTLRSGKGEAGAEARAVLQKVIEGMRLTDDLKEPRNWISARLKGIQLSEVTRIRNPEERYLRLIEVQNLLFSQLAVDPRAMAPYFHLGGVVHLMGMSLAREKKTYFPNQESWSNAVQPLLASLIQYVGDFPSTGKDGGERSAILSNLESLLQDYLLLKQKISK